MMVSGSKSSAHRRWRCRRVMSRSRRSSSARRPPRSASDSASRCSCRSRRVRLHGGPVRCRVHATMRRLPTRLRTPGCSSGCRYACHSRRPPQAWTACTRAAARLGSARVGTPPRTRAPTPLPALHLPSRFGPCAGTRTRRVERARTGAAAPTLADTCHCHLQTRLLPRTDLAQPALTHAAYQPGSRDRATACGLCCVLDTTAVSISRSAAA